MGSVGNSNQNTWPPYDTYKDCSQGICSMYCPQWCDIIFPPPPPFTSLGFDRNDDSFDNDFSPLIIAIIGILATAFVLVCYYTLISKCCRRRDQVDTNSTLELNDQLPSSGSDLHGQAWRSGGLDESVIKSITVAKYKNGDGLIEGVDCSVCLSEFQENENLRLLPKCNHAFHVPCIDMWLKSHANCPLCRVNIVVTLVSTHPPAPTQLLQAEDRSIDSG